MTLKEKHKKHGNLSRPNMGRFGRIEFCLVGTSCDKISSFVDGFRNFISTKSLHIAYVDASHKENEPTPDISKATQKNNEFSLVTSKTNEWHLRADLLDADIVFINGNHFEANNQLVFLDKSKINSLKKRANWLNDIQLFVNVDSELDSFPFLINSQNQSIENFDSEDLIPVYTALLKKYNQKTPTLKALVLSGGKSLRMGKDKSKLKYFGEAHEIHLAKIIASLNLDVYISKREKTEAYNFPVLEDRVLDLGPFGAILTAFMEYPDSAWLVIACDLPFINKHAIERLIDQRDCTKLATAYKAASKEFPEPLISIWEPKAYHVLLKFLAQGISCPRKVLINSEIKEVLIEDEKILDNINTAEEYQNALDYLESLDG